MKSYNVIAEIGSNWDDLDGIINTIEHVSVCGAQSFKLQLLRSDKLYDRIRAPKIYEMMKQFEIPYSWLAEIKAECKKFGLDFWLSVFDKESANAAVKHADVIKLASGDLVNEELLRYAASLCQESRKPLAISTGAANSGEIWGAFHILWNYDLAKIIVFNCVSDYPASIESYRLSSMNEFMFECDEMGLSDHTSSNILVATSRALGYSCFEKHVIPNKLRRNTPDSEKHAISMKSLESYVNTLRSVDVALNNYELTIGEEKERLWARRGSNGLRPTDTVNEGK